MIVRGQDTDLRPRTSRRFRSGGLALLAAVVAAGAATAASIALTPTLTMAHADPGDTVVPIGSSRLVQSEDLTSIQVGLDTETVVLGRDADFSACLGEGNAWTSVLRGSRAPLTAYWTRHDDDERSLSESITQAASPSQAKGFETTLLNDAVRACRKPKFDFHYGPLQSSRVGDGYATWALSYRGKQRRADGGVVVVRKGLNVGFVQVNGTWGPAAQTLESVAKVAVDRLG